MSNVIAGFILGVCITALILWMTKLEIETRGTWTYFNTTYLCTKITP